MKNPMLDKDFLKQLMEHRNRTIHARITALTMAELPVEIIEGSVTGGSISIDGTSAVRRTCNLSLVGKKSVITDIHWAIRNKFKLEIGVENTINQKYDDIIWFKQGIYGITNFSYSENSNSCTISIQGKDKMAYLDGTFGGNITAQTDFGKWDEIDAEGNVTTYDQLIYNIIRNILHEFAGEPYQNIVIEDLDQFGYELWEYRGDKEYPMYYFYDIEESKFVNATINGDMRVILVNEDGEIATDLKSLAEDELYQYAIHKTGKPIYIPGDTKHKYYIAKIEYGEVAGYHKTGLIFAGELVGNPGETVVAILDKIKNMLGAFEYFYDLDGRFRFKKQDNYIYGSLSPLSGETKDTLAATANQKISYNFEGNSMVSSISNSPGVAELKNDFVVWGVKKSAAGGEIPIHARYAVCRKPQSYITFDNYTRIYPCYIGAIEHTGEDKQPLDIQPYVKSGDDYAPVRWRKDAQYVELIQGMLEPDGGDTIYVPNNGRYVPWDNNTPAYYKDELGFHEIKLSGNLTHGEYYILTEASRVATSSEYDWRELLYLMARDYYQHHEFPSYTLDLISRGYLDGKTGYEPFYADMQAFWRQLYKPLLDTDIATEFIQTSSTLASHVNVIKKPAGSIPIEDSYNGYILATKEDDPETLDINESFNYLKPLAAGESTVSKDYYLLNQSEPGKLSAVTDIISGGAIKVLKDDAVADVANPNCYTYAPKFYKADDSFYPINGNSKWPGWSKETVLSPESLIFWIDFLDTAGSIGEYSMQNIGHRPKVEPSDQMIKTIYNRATPSVEFVVYPDKIDPDDQIGQTLQLSPLQINQSMEAAFTISSQGLSAADKIDELVYKHLCQAEGISMTTIPVYYLEPNTVIYAESDNVNVQGNYLVTQLSIPLTYNGTMSITAHKLVKYLK